MSEDPFERAVARENALLRRAKPEIAKVIRLVVGFRLILIAGWGVLVALHFALWPDPRWLRLAHLIVFVLTGGYWIAAMAFVRVFMRRIPGLDRSPEPPGYRHKAR